MTSLNFNGGQMPTRTIPRADTSHGKVLYAMYLYGSQTAIEFEPYRVCRRVNILRDYPDDKIKIYP